ncbi:MAG: DUF3990 domain-containing protein [Bacteroidales bacterium]|nr:DUF3990 domain-containing protein [Bacteroidales bacterium]
MKLYHGSNVSVVTPDLIHSKPFKDFGRGFYLSSDRQQAWEMALQKVSQTKEGKPEISEFLLDENLMHSTELRVLSYSDYTEEWAEFVLANRNRKNPQPVHNYDIVYGPIADDGVTFQLRRYEGGLISLPKLVEELRYAKGITFQYFFGTDRALKHLIRT